MRYLFPPGQLHLLLGRPSSGQTRCAQLLSSESVLCNAATFWKCHDALISTLDCCVSCRWWHAAVVHAFPANDNNVACWASSISTSHAALRCASMSMKRWRKMNIFSPLNVRAVSSLVLPFQFKRSSSERRSSTGSRCETPAMGHNNSIIRQGGKSGSLKKLSLIHI